LERDLALVRIIVATLGERVAPPWWRTQFLTDAGVASMAMLFPRRGFAAAAESTVEAARQLHDARVAKHGRFHLFRLPTAQERAVGAEWEDEDFMASIAEKVAGGQETLLQLLRERAVGRQAPAGEGPISLGFVSNVLTRADVERVCACYVAAFGAGTMVFPYFDAEQSAEA